MKPIIYTFCALWALMNAGIAFAKSDVDVAAQVSGSFRAGRVPTGADSSSLVMDVVFLPAFSITRTVPRGSYNLSYNLNVSSSFSQMPQQSLQLFHQFSAGHNWALSKRTSWSSSAGINFGSVDYSRSLFLFDPTGDLATSRPDTPIVKFMSINSGSSLSWRVSRISQWSVALNYSTMRQLSSSEPLPVPNDPLPDDSPTGTGNTGDLPTSHNIGGSLSFSTQLSSIDSASVSVGAGVVPFSTGELFISFSPAVSWSRQATEDTAISAAAGVSGFMQQTGPDNNGPWELTVLPFGSFGASNVPNWDTVTRWSFQCGLSVDGYIDPVLATLLPRAMLSLNAASQIQPRVQFSVGISAGSPLANTNPSAYQTAGSVQSSLNIELSRDLQLSFGTTANRTATYPFSKNVKFGPYELSAMVSLSYAIESRD